MDGFCFYFNEEKNNQNMNNIMNANRNTLCCIRVSELASIHCGLYERMLNKITNYVDATKLTHTTTITIRSLSSFHAVNENNLSHFLVLQLEFRWYVVERWETNSIAFYKVCK